MADHYYGVDMGQAFGTGGVSLGTSTTSKQIELRVLDGVNGNNKTQIVMALKKIEAEIMTGNAPA